jgi:hypothetical protein
VLAIVKRRLDRRKRLEPRTEIVDKAWDQP